MAVTKGGAQTFAVPLRAFVAGAVVPVVVVAAVLEFVAETGAAGARWAIARVHRFLNHVEREPWFWTDVHVDARAAGVVLGLVVVVLARAVCT